ncbi:MAG TPA: peptidoglycan-binding protein [Acidimicrobiales bacterium]|nr:peptidoglycan-binding protein [Acidimicrobiales bacterium]
MRDLQHRLSALGFDASADEPGVFGTATASAVRAFQDHRGLPLTGACDATTWEALVEAGWRLGDRPLYRTMPMLRGDDVADLQRRLGAIGFDAGRVDGIFGPRTDRALTDFQRNYGLVADSICGPATVGALARLGDRHLAPASVVDVRERERFRCGPRTLDGRIVVLAHAGGLDALTTSAARHLRTAGATVQVVEHPDGSQQAAQANDLDADVFLSVAMAASGDRCRVAYYRAPAGWESQAGRRLAELLHEAIAGRLPCDDRGITPMTIPVLRETRMAAVALELAPATEVVAHTGDLAAALPHVLEEWLKSFSDGS